MRHVRRRGASVVELLVVTGVAAAILCLLVPAVQRVRESANRAVCANNLKQIGYALTAFEENVGAFPMAMESSYGAYWTALVLPYLGRTDIYNAITFSHEGAHFAWTPPVLDASLTSPNIMYRNIAACETIIPIYRCPSTASALYVTDASDYAPVPWYVAKRVPITYLGCASGLAVDDFRSSTHISMLDGIMIARPPGTSGIDQIMSSKGPGYVKIVDVRDGLSNTIIVGEAEPFVFDTMVQEDANAGRVDHWAIGGDDCDNWEGTDWSETCGSTGVPVNYRQPPNATREQIGMAEVAFSSNHANPGAYVLFGDGSVRYATNAISRAAWSALGTRTSGDIAAPDF